MGIQQVSSFHHDFIKAKVRSWKNLVVCDSSLFLRMSDWKIVNVFLWHVYTSYLHFQLIKPKFYVLEMALSFCSMHCWTSFCYIHGKKQKVSYYSFNFSWSIQVVDVISSHPEHDIIIGIDSLGKEDLLLHIAHALKIKVSSLLERKVWSSVVFLRNVTLTVHML